MVYRHVWDVQWRIIFFKFYQIYMKPKELYFYICIVYMVFISAVKVTLWYFASRYYTGLWMKVNGNTSISCMHGKLSLCHCFANMEYIWQKRDFLPPDSSAWSGLFTRVAWSGYIVLFTEVTASILHRVKRELFIIVIFL